MGKVLQDGVWFRDAGTQAELLTQDFQHVQLHPACSLLSCALAVLLILSNAYVSARAPASALCLELQVGRMMQQPGQLACSRRSGCAADVSCTSLTTYMQRVWSSSSSK
jgi:hypothetical protein